MLEQHSTSTDDLKSRIDLFKQTYSFAVENKTVGKKVFETYLVSAGNWKQNFIRVTHPLGYWTAPGLKDYLEEKNTKHMLDILKELPTDAVMNPEQIKSLVETSKQFAKDKFVNAGKVGSAVHAHVETGVAGEVPEEMKKQVQQGILAFEEFAKTNTLTCLSKELQIFSQTYGVAGTIDDISTDGESVWITDWKTGRYNPKMGWQVACYGIMFKEHFGITPKLRLMMLDKYSGKVTPINYEHNEHLQACYLGILQAFCGENWKALGAFWPWNLTHFHELQRGEQ